MTMRDVSLPDYWDRKALTTEFSTPLPAEWIESSGQGKARTRVLDAGCGQGRILDALASVGWTRLWGVDFSPEMVRCASQRLCTRARIVCASLRELPFDDACFDLVLCFGVVNTIADDCNLRAVCKELARVTIDRGRMLINDYGLGTGKFDRERYLAALPETGVYGRFRSDGMMFHHRPPTTVAELLCGCFEVQKCEQLTFTTMTGRERDGYCMVTQRIPRPEGQ